MKKPSAYKARIGYLREAAEALGLEVWQMSDAMLVRRLGRTERVSRILQAASPSPSKQEGQPHD